MVGGGFPGNLPKCGKGVTQIQGKELGFMSATSSIQKTNQCLAALDQGFPMAAIRNQNALPHLARSGPADLFPNFFPQAVEAEPGVGGNINGGKTVPFPFQGNGTKISLVDNQQRRPALAQPEGLLIAGGGQPATVENQQDQVGTRHFSYGPPNTLGFNRVVGGANTSGIDDPKRYSAKDQGLFDGVPSGPGNFGDDRPIFSEQGVEKGTLPGVGRAKDQQRQSLAQSPPNLETGKHPVDPGDNRTDSRHQPIEGGRGKVIFWEIDPGLDFGQDRQEDIPQPENRLREGALKLSEGKIPGCRRASLDEINDRLSPGQVEPAIQKGAQGEFPGFCQAGPAIDQQVENAGNQGGPTVAVNFGNIFSGEGTRSAHKHRHYLVEGVPGAILYQPMIKPMGEDFSNRGGGAEKPPEQSSRRIPGDADYGHPPFAGGGGRCHDGICSPVQHGSLSELRKP